ncbi:MAG: serine hydrolase, partial [Candidatus Saccharicenans sp.]|nr:serine hydrolase [Candidatus Saccharicenans sp.]
MRRKSSALIVLFFLIVLVASPGLNLFGQAIEATQKIIGHWEGAIELPGMKLEVLVDFKLSAENQLEGTVSIPIQKAKDLPLADIKLSGYEISFAIAGVPGNPVFQGKLNESGQKISGN